MSVRARSWLGALLTAAGVVLMVVAMVGAKVEGGVPAYSGALLWGGLALAVAGVVVIFWSLFGAVRQIDASEAQFEARLRAEADAQREQNRPS